MAPRSPFDRELLVRIFFFGAFAFLLTQLFLLAKPFLPALLISVILAITFFPLYRRVYNATKNPHLAALLSTMAVVLAAVVPLAWFLWLMARESSVLIPSVQNVLAEIKNGDGGFLQEKLPPFLNAKLETLSQSFNMDFQSIIMDNVRALVGKLTDIGVFAARNAVFIFFKLMILVFSLFFFFRDGEKFWNWFLNLIPMELHHKQAVARSAYETFRAVSVGVFLTAAAQGVTAMIGFLIAGVRMPIFLGLATSMVALLGASFIVCLPVALFVMSTSFSKGIFLLLWGMVLVGWLDNLLKPILIGSRARMPFVLVFFSLLGGLKMYGLVGLILGPVLVACVLTFIRIYREAYSA